MRRRRLLPVAIALAIALGLLSTALTGSSAAAAGNPLGGTASVVYFPQTGHHIQGAFLTYWLDNGGLNIFGYPLTEEFGQNGLTVQYFQRARFELHKTSNGSQVVLLGLLGNEITNNKSTGPFQPYPKSFTYKNNANHMYFPQTGHFLNYGFMTYWQDNGGAAIFGYPTSEEFKENGLTVQYFQRARFEYHLNNPPGFQVQLGLLGSQMAAIQHVSTKAVAKRSDAATWPNISTLPAKWIEINLTTQYLTAWQGNTAVFGQYISAGLPDTPTPIGVFSVYEKLPFDDMTGGTPGTPDYYFLPNVPNVMYFLAGGYAIHGAYWHANFGYPISHGCINMTLSGAAWMYQWTPLGTPVWIHN